MMVVKGNKVCLFTVWYRKFCDVRHVHFLITIPIYFGPFRPGDASGYKRNIFVKIKMKIHVVEIVIKCQIDHAMFLPYQ